MIGSGFIAGFHPQAFLGVRDPLLELSGVPATTPLGAGGE
jgi:hypothetical protein